MSQTTKTSAVRIHSHGGPEVLTFEDIDLPLPGPDEILIRHTAIGINYIDTYHRSGLYGVELPFIPGTEGAGVIESVGTGVKEYKIGDRVAYAGRSGSYCGKRIMPANRVIKIPDSLSDEVVAASIVKGLTAEYLIQRTYKVKQGETILVHAAAGGVGSILCQWANHLGAQVIGTVGSKDKAIIALKNGCHHTILYREENIPLRVKDITNGKGVSVVYDSVGADTFESSLDSLAPRGMLVSFGNASGPVPPFAPLILSQKGSLFFTRPSLWHYIADTEEYKTACDTLFDVLTRGIINIQINQRYRLADAAQAHRDLESRKTTGSSLLIP